MHPPAAATLKTLTGSTNAEDTPINGGIGDASSVVALEMHHAQYGQTNEASARLTYGNGLQEFHHKDASVSKCGLLIHKDLPVLAASPDGAVSCAHCVPTEGGGKVPLGIERPDPRGMLPPKFEFEFLVKGPINYVRL
jgi:hypothetical protein